jgi:hypothetical protein
MALAMLVQVEQAQVSSFPAAMMRWATKPAAKEVTCVSPAGHATIASLE